MIVSINQPAYLPWGGYFDRIAKSDLHVVLNHVQFEKNSLVNRNRVLGKGGPAWLTVPVRTKGRFGELAIDTVEIDNSQRWVGKHLKTLQACYGKTCGFDLVYSDLEAVLKQEHRTLASLCAATTAKLMAALEVDVPMVYSRETGITTAKSQLVLDICRHVEATTYLSGPFGRDYLDLEAFAAAGIAVEFHSWAPEPYDQGGDGIFDPKVSVIDVLCRCGSAAGMAVFR